MPLAWLMGVPWEDCYYVGQLIGTKTIVNEFVGYKQLSEYVKQGLISVSDSTENYVERIEKGKNSKSRNKKEKR